VSSAAVAAPAVPGEAAAANRPRTVAMREPAGAASDVPTRAIVPSEARSARRGRAAGMRAMGEG